MSSSSSLHSEDLRTALNKLTIKPQHPPPPSSDDSSSDPLDALKADPAWKGLLHLPSTDLSRSQRQSRLAYKLLARYQAATTEHSQVTPSESSTHPSSHTGDDDYEASNGEDVPLRLSSELEKRAIGSPLHSNDECDEQDEQDEIDLILCDPMVWCSPVLEIRTLGCNIWLGGTILHFYTIRHWLNVRKEATMHFVDMSFTTGGIRALPTEEEKATHLKRNGHRLPIPLRPVVFIVFHSNHYFTVVFDYEKLSAYVFGSSITQSGFFPEQVPWKDWSGPQLWDRVEALLGWDAIQVEEGEDVEEDKDVTVVARQWLQNGQDCGPITASVVVCLLHRGLEFDSLGKLLQPNIECAHKTRQKMLDLVAVGGFESFSTWKRITHRNPDTWQTAVVDRAINLFTERDTLRKKVRDLSIQFTKAEIRCPECQQAQAACRKAAKLGGDSPSSPESSSFGPAIPKQLTANPLMKGARNRERIRPRLPKFNPNTIELTDEQTIFTLLPSNLLFDEYHNGPTIEDNYTYPKHLDNYPTNPFAIPTTRSCWESFKDYGYRIEPSFALAFNSDQPWMVKEHLLPVGPQQEAETVLDRITGGYSLDRHGLSTRVDVNDIRSMGMERMLEEAGAPGTPSSFYAFVCGRLGTDFIHMNPEEDAAIIVDDDVVLRLDIDSIIWVTHHLRFIQAIKVFVLPYEGKKAPIHQHNHTYVEILMPRSDEDKEAGGRKEWFSKPFRLSHIPHTHFARMGDGAGSMNIYVAFPRMIHRDELRGFRVNNIPFEVQALWFERVILPSIVASTVSGCLEYTDFTLEEWRWKASGSHRFVDTKTTPLRASATNDMQVCMRRIIAENPDLLDMFGSFFFVCDIRGSKGLTTEDDPYDALCKEYPGVDWEYAMKRENGQLYFDLGISFHPLARDKTPIVGLWRLDHVQASYDANGMTKGTVHHACTLANYGGMQAEMQIQRRKAVQLSFRSTYALYFEAIRRPGSNPYFCDDSEAYDVSPNFLDFCDRYDRIFRGSQRKSFGVREEIRGSGPAIKIALQHAKDRAKLYLKSQPILWVRSETWFSFLSRRMLELRNLQMKLSKIRPPNYGIATSVIMYLIRYVAITPINTHTYLNNALMDLNFGPHVERFGMFFLHDIDLENGVFLHGCEAEDDREVGVVMKVDQKRRRRARAAPPLVNSEPNATYPFGDSPSWNTIVQAVQESPEKILRPWSWNDVWDRNQHASALFVQMTVDLWLSVVEKRLNGPAPKPSNLEEAMRCWTLTGIQEAVIHPSFQASNSNLHGARKGKRQPQFHDFTNIVFPPPDTEFNPKSVWLPFVNKGYIKKYHTLCRRLSPSRLVSLMDVLRTIFSKLQCFPPIARCGSDGRKVGRIWRMVDGYIQLVTNSKFYKVAQIGNPEKLKKRVGGRVRAAQAVIEGRLDEVHRGIPYRLGKNEARKRQAQQKSSKKANYRKPPQRKRREDPPGDHKDIGGAGGADSEASESESEEDDGTDIEEEGQEDYPAESPDESNCSDSE